MKIKEILFKKIIFFSRKSTRFLLKEKFCSSRKKNLLVRKAEQKFKSRERHVCFGVESVKY